MTVPLQLWADTLVVPDAPERVLEASGAEVLSGYVWRHGYWWTPSQAHRVAQLTGTGLVIPTVVPVPTDAPAKVARAVSARLRIWPVPEPAIVPLDYEAPWTFGTFGAHACLLTALLREDGWLPWLYTRVGWIRRVLEEATSIDELPDGVWLPDWNAASWPSALPSFSTLGLPDGLFDHGQRAWQWTTHTSPPPYDCSVSERILRPAA